MVGCNGVGGLNLLLTQLPFLLRCLESRRSMREGKERVGEEETKGDGSGSSSFPS